MLTRDLLRARLRNGQIRPQYVDGAMGELATQLVELFTQHQGRPRAVLDAALAERIGERTDFLLYRGLAKLLFDRSVFIVDAKAEPREVRRRLFERAARGHAAVREGDALALPPERGTMRASAIAGVASELSLKPEDIEQALYADLEEAQILSEFEPLSGEELLQRYNVALAQAVLLRATQVEVKLAPTNAKRVRQLFRFIKFFRLMHQVRGTARSGYELTLDGPMSLFQLSSKYGLRLAEFLPALLLCPGWTLTASVQWGPIKQLSKFELSSEAGLVSHYRDTGTYETDEERAFRERWKLLDTPWKLERTSSVIDLDGKGVLVPDFTLRHPDGREALLEIVGFWRRASLDSRLEVLKKHGPPHLILAVSQRLRGSEDDLAQIPGEVFFFKDVILTRDVLERAERLGRQA
jgi:predicted nuclease of restriction endonuclease-like RecB superfamily